MPVAVSLLSWGNISSRRFIASRPSTSLMIPVRILGECIICRIEKGCERLGDIGKALVVARFHQKVFTCEHLSIGFGKERMHQWDVSQTARVSE